MKKEELLFNKYIHNFVFKNWEDIDLNRAEIKQSKEDFLKEVLSNVETSVWVLMEVCLHYMKSNEGKKFYKSIEVETEDCDFYVFKIDNNYYKVHYYYTDPVTIDFVKPKFKKVMYF